MDPRALECHRRAGAIAAECREWARDRIRPGTRIRDVLEGIEALIAERGASPAFPAQSSRNHVAAHYCSPPDDATEYAEGDCVKVDLGVHVDGYVADTATSVDLSPDGRWSALIAASADALAAAISAAGDRVPTGRIGAVVEETITAAGFQPIRNLTGHGVGRWQVHVPPLIPNCAERNTPRLRGGTVIAIEPFASTGVGHVEEVGEPEVFMLLRSPSERKGLDRKVLGAIEGWRGLPVARRYFRDLDADAVDRTLRGLARRGALRKFGPLSETAGTMTAQTEHTLYLGPDGVEVLTALPA